MGAGRWGVARTCPVQRHSRDIHSSRHSQHFARPVPSEACSARSTPVRASEFEAEAYPLLARHIPVPNGHGDSRFAGRSRGGPTAPERRLELFLRCSKYSSDLPLNRSSQFPCPRSFAWNRQHQCGSARCVRLHSSASAGRQRTFRVFRSGEPAPASGVSGTGGANPLHCRAGRGQWFHVHVSGWHSQRQPGVSRGASDFSGGGAVAGIAREHAVWGHHQPRPFTYPPVPEHARDNPLLPSPNPDERVCKWETTGGSGGDAVGGSFQVDPGWQGHCGVFRADPDG